MILREKQIAFQILTPCTLNCRLCADYAPLYREKGIHYFVTLENFGKEINEVFKIYDFIEDITITGGEPLLHPQLTEILTLTLKNFSSQFHKCRIFTNGTIIPKTALLDQVVLYGKNNFEFVIDDYGAISANTARMESLLSQYGISYRINHYYGDKQHCGGWIDYGPLDLFHNESREMLQAKIQNCHNANWKNLLVFKGKLYLCTQAAFGHDLNYFSLQSNEYIDLLDETTSITEKKAIAFQLGKEPISSCQYCNGFDVEKSQRFPAGEQK